MCCLDCFQSKTEISAEKQSASVKLKVLGGGE